MLQLLTLKGLMAWHNADTLVNNGCVILQKYHFSLQYWSFYIATEVTVSAVLQPRGLYNNTELHLIKRSLPSVHTFYFRISK